MKMKNLAKILALAVLAIFILSIPAALAENGNGVEGVEKAKLGSEIKDIKVTENVAKEAKTGLVKDIKEAKAEAKSLVEKAKENILDKKSYELLKERHETVKKAYDEQKEKVKTAREESKTCKDDSEKCTSKKTELKTGVKNHLVKTIELIQNSFERLNSKVQDSKVMTEEEKVSALAMIKENQDKLNAEMEKLNALSENATNEELRTAIKEVKELWQEANRAERYLITQLVNNKLENLVEKHNEYYNAMQMRIKSLADAGQNVDALNAVAEKFKAASDKLAADNKLAEEKWLEARTEKTREALEIAHQAQRVVREDLKETKKLIREFLVQFKEQYKELKAENKAAKEAETETVSEEGTTAEE